jgi:hypothetical protein
MTLRDQLARFHAVVTGMEPLESARELVVSDRIDANERLHVYRHAYTARLADALVHDFPKLAKATDLRALVPDYVRAHPSTQPSLRELGAHLAEFAMKRGLSRHLVDLAVLERARLEVFDGPDAVALLRDDLAELDPAEFPSLRLQLVPSSRIVSLSTNADDVWDAIEDEREPPALAEVSRDVLVWRRDYVVIHRTLEPDEARVASALAVGTTFGDLCDALDASAERAIELLVRWLDAQILWRA